LLRVKREKERGRAKANRRNNVDNVFNSDVRGGMNEKGEE